MKAHCDVLIQGAGIAGLTLAIALEQRGYKVKLVERSDGLTEVGAGIWMAANPMQVFSRLGFAEKINTLFYVAQVSEKLQLIELRGER